MPDSEFLRHWNFVIAILLTYVALYVPYNVCFSEVKIDNDTYYTTSFYVDLFVDFLFFIDIPINFVSAYYDPESNLPVVELKLIAKNYIGTWFIIDFVTVLPIDFISKVFLDNSNIDGLFGENNDANRIKLARLARLPRIYKILRLLRMSKMFKVA